jgi:hypothetical protein
MVRSQHDYGRALNMSLQFYKAQRSGRLPDRDIPWRRDSFMNDRTSDGRDVTGGFFDAGDHIKFMLPQGATLTILAHGLVDFQRGYTDSGQYGQGLQVLKWGADFFTKCVISPTRIVGQIGTSPLDHSQWVRPEDIKTPYPVFELTPQKPGADVAGEIASTLAAASIVFNRTGTGRDPAAAARYLRAAETAYQFGRRYPGRYHSSLGEASGYYKSTSQFDDMGQAAVWLFRATRRPNYLQEAREYLARNIASEGFGWVSNDWDNVQRMLAVQLAAIEPNRTDATRTRLIREFRNAWLTGGNGAVKRTPKGLMWLAPWGSLRHNSLAQYVMLAHGKMSRNATAWRESVCWARRQMGYILGDTGRSFVVGYGRNWPQQPHHRGASCPNQPTVCGWDWFNRDAPNPRTIVGALVGGPGVNDDYKDKRSDYISNEQAIDYNSGFTVALAALIEGRDVRC